MARTALTKALIAPVANAAGHGLDRWLHQYVLDRPKRRAAAARRRAGTPVHVLIAVADHYEPHNGRADLPTARARLQKWVTDYPARLGSFADSGGRPPRHSFFYPLEQYDPFEVDALAGLCRRGFGEVEVHLHHDNETADNLRARLTDYARVLASRHGLLARRRDNGALAWGFVHGDWALDNSHPHGRFCGVNNELDVLRETGCYADFTLPSAPEPTQTGKINSIYYAVDNPHQPKSHDTGTDVGAAPAPPNALMIIQGPLVLDWGRRKLGVMPGIENGCLQSTQPASARRLDLWLNAAVQVPTRPDWYFVKLHAHGAPEVSHETLIGAHAEQFHRALADRARRDPNFHYHYVTAREMYNLARAAEAGWTGTVEEARDFELLWNGSAAPVGSLATASA